jgi:hypothetical protein
MDRATMKINARPPRPKPPRPEKPVIAAGASSAAQVPGDVAAATTSVAPDPRGEST